MIWVLAVGFCAVASACSDVSQGADPSSEAGSGNGRPKAGSGGAKSEEQAASGSEGPPPSGGGGRSGAGAGGAGAGGAGSGAAGATAEPVDDGEATWSNVYQFSFRTCRNPDCHGGGIIGLNFASKDAAYESMLNQPAYPMGQCVMLAKQRLVPGDPDNSLLYLKLDQNAPCGQNMPPGGQLPPKERDRVRTWIMNGAKND